MTFVWNCVSADYITGVEVLRLDSQMEDLSRASNLSIRWDQGVVPPLEDGDGKVVRNVENTICTMPPPRKRIRVITEQLVEPEIFCLYY